MPYGSFMLRKGEAVAKLFVAELQYTVQYSEKFSLKSWMEVLQKLFVDQLFNIYGFSFIDEVI